MFGSGSNNVGSGTESRLGPGLNQACVRDRLGIESPLQGEFVRLINLQSVACAKSLTIICVKL